MNNSAKIVTMLCLALFLAPTAASAQIRGAASKALGEYGHGEQTARRQMIVTNPIGVRAATPAAPQPNAVASEPTRQGANRVFSYDAPAQARQPQPARRFSYEPAFANPRASYSPSSRLPSGFRDAGSKIRGDY
jgi:hypothetical protein